MAVVQPKRSSREQLRIGGAMVATGVVGFIMAGVVGPIILAVLVGVIWGH